MGVGRKADRSEDGTPDVAALPTWPGAAGPVVVIASAHKPGARARTRGYGQAGLHAGSVGAELANRSPPGYVSRVSAGPPSGPGGATASAGGGPAITRRARRASPAFSPLSPGGPMRGSSAPTGTAATCRFRPGAHFPVGDDA